MMEDWICRQNIQRWRNQLETACDESQREVLVVLLAEEREKLRRFTTTPGSRHRSDTGAPGVSS